MEITLGQKVRCKITGFQGTATSKVEYINGCVQYCVMPKVGVDGKMPEGVYIDQAQIEVIEGETKITPSKRGGPQRDCPKY